MQILGIDPGIGRMGWGIVAKNGQKISPVGFGCFETSKNSPPEERLAEIYAFLKSLLSREKVDTLAIEDLFFNTNTKTAFLVGQARGVVLLLAAQESVPVHVYTPLQVKVAVAGYGRADKRQVGEMVKVLLSLESIPRPDDTADALAIAITHAFTAPVLSGR